jgi:arginine-tRNA-protein transferase
MEEKFFIHQLPFIKGVILDKYLEAGWYRMGGNIFTTDSFEEFNIVYPVFWLRYKVRDIFLDKHSRSIIKKNKKFVVNIVPFKNSNELESLHDLYFEKIDFLTSFTINELLEDVDNLIYDTFLIEIRDNEKLIAAGIFDKGQDSIAGIKNIYHPEYFQYSLGKYLMLIKLQYCLQNNIEWYYPGYIAPGHKKFDYKLFVDKNATEVFVHEIKNWISYKEFIE